MKKLSAVFAAVLRKSEPVVKPKVAYAHCDVPCGLYETDTITHSAETVYKMVEKILALQHPEQDERKKLEFENTVTRMIVTKEEHAQLCKEQMLILWTDYFKEEHLSKFPDLHTKVWKATKLCSDAKRVVDLQVAQRLMDAVAEIAHIFAATKR